MKQCLALLSCSHQNFLKRHLFFARQKLKSGKYEHYKGKQYEIVGVARHSETLEELVVYRALYNSKEFGKDALWARPLKMFLEEVEIEGKKIPRFKFIENQK